MSTNQPISTKIGLKNQLFKNMTLALFYILPSRITSVFISLSIINLIFSVRNSCLAKDSATVDRVGKMLGLHLDEGILMLPEQTCKWYWSDSFLSTRVKVSDGEHTMRELIADKKLFIRHRNLVLNKLLEALPKSITGKLGLNSGYNRLVIKHNITSAILYA